MAFLNKGIRIVIRDEREEEVNESIFIMKVELKNLLFI